MRLNLQPGLWISLSLVGAWQVGAWTCLTGIRDLQADTSSVYLVVGVIEHSPFVTAQQKLCLALQEWNPIVLFVGAFKELNTFSVMSLSCSIC